MIETIAKNFSSALLNFADVDQHPSYWIDRTGEDEIGNVISAAAIARACFRSKRCRVLLLSPTNDVQASRCGKFQAFADGQEHTQTIVGRLCETASNSEASDTDALQLVVQQREEFGARSRVFLENAEQARRFHHRILLLNSAHHHAEMFCLNDHTNATGMQCLH